ncbi:MAG: Nramp family divalent metal transporter [Candidatus Pacebacteria bacterium]|nr:Nramp family divalent metal transporter [Candidatus Paceibacterota bacterium]
MRLPQSARRFLHALGPGIITGAADDDPSGITTYSQAGALAGFQLLWTAVFTTPLMISIQEMCARIGLVTGMGLSGVLRKHYHRSILYVLAIVVTIANTINIGADIAGMAETTHLLVNIPQWSIAVLYSLVILCFVLFSSYHMLVRYMKWLVLALLCYFLVPFTIHIPWHEVWRQTFFPTFTITKEVLLVFVGVLGTTISPYLFFWQADIEVEDHKNNALKKIQRWIVTKNELTLMREDVTLGMILSNITMWFIILTTAVTLFPNGITNITTAQQAADALRPLVGDAAYLLFMLGIVGTGLLTIPILAGSTSYVLSGAFGWTGGLDKPFHKAKKFYAVIIASTFLGVLMSALGISPVHMLLSTAVLYGVLAPPLIVIIMHIANNRDIMKTHTNGFFSNILGTTTLILMTAAVGLLFYFGLR